MMKCNEIIYNLRKSRKLEQTKVAADLGVSREILNHWESGTRQIKAEHIVKLANYYNVSADYILGLSPHETVSADLAAVCDFTGLSVEAVTAIKNRNDIFDLSDLLSSDRFLDIVAELDNLRMAYNKTGRAIEEAKSSNNEEDLYYSLEDLCEWLPNLRLELFELSEMWSSLVEQFFPSRELISEGKELLEKHKDFL